MSISSSPATPATPTAPATTTTGIMSSSENFDCSSLDAKSDGDTNRSSKLEKTEFGQNQTEQREQNEKQRQNEREDDEKSVEDDELSISLSDNECNIKLYTKPKEAANPDHQDSVDRSGQHESDDENTVNATFYVLPPPNRSVSQGHNEEQEQKQETQYQIEEGDVQNGTIENGNDDDSPNNQQELLLQREQIRLLMEQTKRKQQKIDELEAALINTSRTCNQLECMLKQELNKRTSLENDNLNLISEICKLRLKLNATDQTKKRDEEKINLLNATLMERETEISILNLKLTRAQACAPNTNQNHGQPSMQLDTSKTSQSSPTYVTQQQQRHLEQPRLRPPSQTYSITRLDSSGQACSSMGTGSLQRNCNLRESFDYAHSQYGAPRTSQQLGTAGFSCFHSSPIDAPVSSSVGNQLFAPTIMSNSNSNAQPIYGNITSPYTVATNGLSVVPLDRGDRRYRTLPRNLPSINSNDTSASATNPDYSKIQHQYNKQRSYSSTSPPFEVPNVCTVTNLDDSNEGGHLITNSDTRTTRDKPNSSTVDRHENVYDNVRSLTSTTNHNNHAPIDDSYYATIDRLGKTSTKPSEVQNHTERVQSVASYNITAPQHRLPSIPKQKSGLRRIFEKFRRSGSNHLVEDEDIIFTSDHEEISNFRRGGTRSTTSGAYPNSSNNQQRTMNMMMANRRAAAIQVTKPFGEWDSNMISDWLTTIGLSMYSDQAKRWAKNGSHIMNATSNEVERGLGISNSLHRKKLRLAISELNGDCDKVTKAAATLDYLWVARWLDDIGLPQYKDQFINNRIDGRVLNYLTVEDLLSMNITSLLHHASIRCGIRVLRSVNFDLQALKRRATSDEINGMAQWSSSNQQQQSSSRTSTLTFGQTNPHGSSNNADSNHGERSASSSSSSSNANIDSSTHTPGGTPVIAPAALGTTGIGSGNRVPSRMPTQPDIALWTCHRVMEWLRLIDFAEFAPNLRGSGVHGGLIIYEDGFNADLMSSLLSIPDDKTLLRRHIYSLFKELIGTELFQQKRQYESHPHHTPLTPTAELKSVKKSQFKLLRRSRSKVGQDTTIEEYLCPMYPIDAQFIKHAAANAAREAAQNSSEQDSVGSNYVKPNIHPTSQQRPDQQHPNQQHSNQEHQNQQHSGEKQQSQPPKSQQQKSPKNKSQHHPSKQQQNRNQKIARQQHLPSDSTNV